VLKENTSEFIEEGTRKSPIIVRPEPQATVAPKRPLQRPPPLDISEATRFYMPGAYIEAEDSWVLPRSPEARLVSKWSDDTDSPRTAVGSVASSEPRSARSVKEIINELRQLEELIKSTISLKGGGGIN
jgi:hypothetical protein